MSFKQSKSARAQTPPLTADGASDTISVFADYNLADRGNGALALNDIIEMLPLPAGYVPVDAILASDDLDTGSAALTLNVGVMSKDWLQNDASSTVGTEFFSASTVAQAGGVARADQKAGFLLAPADHDRAIGIKVQAAPGTPAVTGLIRLTVQMRAQIENA